MTREQEIIQEFVSRTDEIIKESINKHPRFAERRVGFIDGAQWADEHPKQGLINIDKVCKWLDENFMNLIWGKTRSVYAGGNFATVDEMIANFREVMEE